ncbi:peroxiredoxin [Chitinophaga sp. Cy-1792]|uniref:peroxiredoxin family protein n=1 Tax=Chitinophaga sp. Cy-1792 TaxID=2608339 RepID=UPI0014228017|nr:redoxin domain-containing protein [Chitinophaga sp. Cy-1792]NIG57027.1 redoxin domain-containing protein [Chitinophaga sp. Cy-1792]
MRYLFLLLSICMPMLLKAQFNQAAANAKPPYLQYPVIPTFKFTLPDGNTITKRDLKRENTLVFVFSVDCDHCKHLTEEVIQNMDKFKKYQILMVTPFQVAQMKEYYEHYNIAKYPNITMVSEPTRQIMYFYDLHFFPGLYIYTAKDKFVKGFEGSAKVDSLLYYLK